MLVCLLVEMQIDISPGQEAKLGIEFRRGSHWAYAILCKHRNALKFALKVSHRNLSWPNVGIGPWVFWFIAFPAYIQVLKHRRNEGNRMLKKPKFCIVQDRKCFEPFASTKLESWSEVRACFSLFVVSSFQSSEWMLSTAPSARERQILPTVVHSSSIAMQTLTLV
jgi:hypothetical protein